MLLVAFEDLGDTEVDQPDFAEAVDHDVGRLHVSEHDRLRLVAVQIVEYVAQLDAPVQHLFDRQHPRTSQQRVEIAAVDVFHHQIRTRIGDEKIEDLGDGGVIQGGQQVCFALKRLQHRLPLILFALRRQHFFDCDQPFGLWKVRVAGLKHRAHAAAAHDTDDPVAFHQQRIDLQAACVRSVTGRRVFELFRIRHKSSSSDDLVVGV
jgi:hypothetical protein